MVNKKYLNQIINAFINIILSIFVSVALGAQGAVAVGAQSGVTAAVTSTTSGITKNAVQEGNLKKGIKTTWALPDNIKSCKYIKF